MLDDFDRRLLELLQRNSRQTAEQLAREVGLSPAACQKRLKRLKRLRDTGVIAREIAVIAHAATGHHLTLIVEVCLERGGSEALAQFKRTMATLLEVQQCYYVTGAADFILVVTATDMASYNDFTRRFLSQNPNIRRFNTNVVRDSVKVGLSVPI